MIKAIIFDYGGVIVNDIDKFLIQNIADKFGVSYDEALTSIMSLLPAYQRGAISDEGFWEQFSKGVNKKSPAGHELLWLDQYTLKIKVDFRMIDLAKRLKANDYIVAVLSNTIPPHAQYNRKQGSFNIFDPIVLSCEVGTRKPEEKIFKLMLDKLDLPSGECIYIDDNREYVDVASRLGMHGLKFDSYEKLIEDIRILGVNA